MYGGKYLCGLMALGLLITLLPAANADVEPNNSLDTPESIVAGTYDGYCSYDDPDYYVISVPAKVKITVTAKLVEGDGLTVTGYDHYKVEHNFLMGIWMFIEAQGATDSDSWTNTKNEPQNIYLGFEGFGSEIGQEAKYTFTIEIGGSSDPDAIPRGEEESCCGGIMIGFLALLALIVVCGILIKRR